MLLKETTGKSLKVFGVPFCLCNKEIQKLDELASRGPDGEMQALCSVMRMAEKISAAPANGNGHNGHGQRAKKSSKPATTTRIGAAGSRFFAAH